MGWSGSLTASSAVGSSITYTPDTTTSHGYSVSAFTAPRDGVFRFILKGSGGAVNGSAYDRYWTSARGSGGAGGTTVGYLNMSAGQTVYIGAGGVHSAAFVSKINISTLAAASSASNLWFVAGAGGGGGAMWDNSHQWSNGNSAGNGASGGGNSGANAGGNGGSQTAGGSGGWNNGTFGSGGRGGYENHEGGLSDSYSTTCGDGGDGLYGGGSGSYNTGGGGGSGYIHASSLSVAHKTYTNSTTQGGGAGSNTAGSVVVTYYARAELPIVYNGQTVLELYYNGQEVQSLVFNGTKVY